MLYSAVGLAVLGAAVGLAFRWKVLLPFIIVLPFLAVPLSVSRGLNYGNIVIVVIAAEAALQGGYFIGLLTRFIGVRSAAFFKRRAIRGHSTATTTSLRHQGLPNDHNCC